MILDATKRALRVMGLLTMMLAVAHCGDSNNNGNDNDGGGSTPIRTVTPTTVVATATPTPVETQSGETPTETPTPGAQACPSAISFQADASNSVLDAGWVGFGHNSKVISLGKITVQVASCANASRPCGVCNLTGPIVNPDAGAGTSNNHRCALDTSIECTGDGDCGANGPCAFFFGAPLPLTAGGVSTCVTNRVVGTITGTANIETGDAESATSLISRVFTGIQNDAPCPVCTGDPTPADGQRGGTCSDGSRIGQACDVGGLSPTFAASGQTSFDCPQDSLAQIAALPINLNTTTGTAQRTLSDASPLCSQFGFLDKRCQCDTCATAAAEPCTSNADCPNSTICGGTRCIGGPNNGATCTPPTTDCGAGGFCSVPGQPTAPNSCASGATCVATATDATRGVCDPEPFDQFCSVQTFQGCLSDTDCQPPPAGTCSFCTPGQTCTGGLRPCYLDQGDIGGSVVSIGQADPPVAGVANPTLAALFCIGPVSSDAVNSAAGLPGLGRLNLKGTAIEIP
jgi:hypothetical protein